MSTINLHHPHLAARPGSRSRPATPPHWYDRYLPAAVVLILSALMPISQVAAQTTGDRALAFVTAQNKNLILQTHPAAVMHELANALVVEADDATLAQIESLSLRYELMPDPRDLRLMLASTNPQTGPLTWSSCASLAPGTETVAMIVAFKPPIVTSVRNALNASGAQVIGSVPPSAFLVRANNSDAQTLDALSDLAHACTLYLPAQRISDRIPSPAFPGTVDIDVLTFPGVSGANLAAAFHPSTISNVLDRDVVRLRVWAHQVIGIAGLDEVEWIDHGDHEGAPFNSQMRVVMQTEKIHPQANQAFYNPIYGMGVWGESQIVTVADSGVTQHAVFAGPFKVLGTVPAGPCVTQLNDATGHGTEVLGVLAGDAVAPGSGLFGTANDFDGLAVRSPLIVQDIVNDQSPPVFCPPDNYPLALYWPAFNVGSMIHNNSWGHWDSRGRYSWRTQAIDRYLAERAFREHVVVFSVGNSGLGNAPYTLSDEAQAKNSISVGGSLNGPLRDYLYQHSSRGPAADCGTSGCGTVGRVKPDIVAPARNFTSTLPPLSFDWRDGTTYAAPAVSAAAALIRDYIHQGKYPRESSDPPLPQPPSSALIKAMLVNATVPLFDPDAYAGNTPQGLPADAYPNYDQGYGRPVLDTVLEHAGYRDLKIWENSSTIVSTGSLWTRDVAFSRVWNPRCNNLRVTLAWSDPAATMTSGPKLVNDLDLEVILNGVSYRGNHRLTSNSFDDSNNVEDVYLPMGQISTPIVSAELRVYGASVPGGRQPFAVVATFGPCFDNIPCDTAGQTAGCYRGPGDTVPQPVIWTPPSTGGCGEQLYLWDEYNGSQEPWPKQCKPPPVVVPVDPVRPIDVIEPIEPIEPGLIPGWLLGRP